MYCGFWDMQANTETDRSTYSTDTLIAILRTFPGGQVLSYIFAQFYQNRLKFDKVIAKTKWYTFWTQYIKTSTSYNHSYHSILRLKQYRYFNSAALLVLRIYCDMYTVSHPFAEIVIALLILLINAISVQKKLTVCRSDNATQQSAQK